MPRCRRSQSLKNQRSTSIVRSNANNLTDFPRLARAPIELEFFLDKRIFIRKIRYLTEELNNDSNYGKNGTVKTKFMLKCKLYLSIAKLRQGLPLTFQSTLGVILALGLTTSPAQAFDYFQTLPDKPLQPSNNPVTKAKAELGKRLFFDPSLSKSREYSCNHCHNVYNGGDDDRAFSPGYNQQLTKRSAPALWNIGLQTVLYWDGRSKSLEDQTKDHLLDKSIMSITKQELLQRLNDKGYKADFQKAFGSTKITLTTVAYAIASFERSLMSPNSPFDRYLKGNLNALSDEAIKGMQAFNEAGCLACHFGVNFAGPAPGPAMGMGDGFYELFPTKRGSEYETSLDLLSDKGLYEFSKKENEIHMWRVPPLRNIALSAPYFHNGSAKTLEQAIKVMGKAQFDFDLSKEKIAEIATFLRSLTGDMPAILNDSKK